MLVHLSPLFGMFIGPALISYLALILLFYNFKDVLNTTSSFVILELALINLLGILIKQKEFLRTNFNLNK